MKRANISELRDHLSEFLRSVRKGESVEVTDRNVPIARLVPVEHADRSKRRSLQQLERSGLVKMGPMRGVPAILRKAPSAKAKTGVLEALLQERRRGR